MAQTSGSCWCGACTYSYAGEPAVKALCHCVTCRKISGGTNTANLIVPDKNFTASAGPIKKFSKEHESGMTLTVFFCTECGSTLWKEASADEFQGLKLVQAGSLLDTSRLNEKFDTELYITERVPWLVPLQGAAQARQFT